MENIYYQDILSKFHQLLLENLNLEKVLHQLIRFGVLTDSDLGEIKKETTQKDKIAQLLMIIRKKGAGAYENFLEALEKGQDFLARQLLKEGR